MKLGTHFPAAVFDTVVAVETPLFQEEEIGSEVPLVNRRRKFLIPVGVQKSTADGGGRAGRALRVGVAAETADRSCNNFSCKLQELNLPFESSVCTDPK